MWGLPGGHALKGEDGLSCIRREIKEELGIDINPHFLYFFEDNGGIKAAYRADLEFDPTEVITNEGIQYRWFSRNEIFSMHLAFKANQVLTKFFQELDQQRNLSSKRIICDRIINE